MLSRIVPDSQELSVFSRGYPFFSGYPFFLAAIRFFSNLVKFPISSHFFAFSQFFHFGTSKTRYEPYFHSVFHTSMLTIVPKSKQTPKVRKHCLRYLWLSQSTAGGNKSTQGGKKIHRLGLAGLSLT